VVVSTTAVQRLLDIRLQLRVEAGHQVVAGDGGGLADRSRDVARGVDRDHLGSGLAAELAVVLGLESRLADQVHAGEAGHGQVPGRDLLRGDRLEVTENLRRVRPVRRGVLDDRLNLGGDVGELALLLHDLQRHPVGHVLVDRDGLVGRAGPAGLGYVRAAQPGLVVQLGVLQAQQRSQPVQDRRGPAWLLFQVHHVHRDDQRRLVRDELGAHVVEDLAADRGHDHVPGLVRRGLLGVRGAVHHLQVIEPPAQRDQHGERQQVEDPQAVPRRRVHR
jgi:hypothetical protein